MTEERGQMTEDPASPDRLRRAGRWWMVEGRWQKTEDRWQIKDVRYGAVASLLSFCHLSSDFCPLLQTPETRHLTPKKKMNEQC